MAQPRSIPYLVERQGRYWARVVIPPDVRPFFCKTELRHPLGGDRREAIRSLHTHVSRFLDEIAAARAKTLASVPARITRPLSVAGIAYAHYQEALVEDDELRQDPRYAAIGDPDEEMIVELRRAAAGASSDDEIDFIVGRSIRKFIGRGNVQAAKGDAEWRQLGRILAAVELEIISRVLERNEGDVTGSPKLPILKERPADLDAVSVPIMGLLDAYLIERSRLGRGAEARRRWTPVFKQFVEYLGHDNATSVTAEKAEEWLADVLTRKAAKTVRDTDLGALKAVFRWAKRRKRVVENPFSEITLDAPKVVKLREKGFTEDEARAVLKAARDYRPADSSNPRTRESATMTAAKRWVPWLCAHTGALVAEVTQLRKEDVRERDGINFIRITPDAGSTKTGAYRDVPIHPQLVEMGLVRFVETSTGPLFYLSTKIRKEGTQHPSKTVSQRIAKWVRNLDVIGSVDPSHGWRHRFKTIGREIGIDSRIVDSIQGHAARTAGDDYGDVTLKVKAAAIAKYPRYDLV